MNQEKPVKDVKVSTPSKSQPIQQGATQQIAYPWMRQETHNHDAYAHDPYILDDDFDDYDDYDDYDPQYPYFHDANFDDYYDDSVWLRYWRFESYYPYYY